jgi:hypothetical protein
LGCLPPGSEPSGGIGVDIQATKALGEDTRCEFEKQLSKDEARTGCGGDWKAATSEHRLKHIVPPGEAQERIVEALKGLRGVHQLAAAYRSRMKARIQLNGESLQGSASAIEQFAH